MDKKGKEFRKFINYLGITEDEFDLIATKLKSINFESIYIHEDKSIEIRYDGMVLYKYEYYFPSKAGKIPKGYEKLDSGVYAGFYDSGLIDFIGPLFDK